MKPYILKCVVFLGQSNTKKGHKVTRKSLFTVLYSRPPAGLLLNPPVQTPGRRCLSPFIPASMGTLAGNWRKVTQMIETDCFHDCCVLFYIRPSKGRTIVEMQLALACIAQWIELQPAHQQVEGSIPSQRCVWEATNPCDTLTSMFFSLSPHSSLPSTL